MAARESVGLQIALVIFVILFLITSVTSVLAYKQAGEAEEQRAAAVAQSAKDNQAKNTAVAEAETLKRMIGFNDPATALAQIEEAFKADMTTFGATLPPEQQVYREVVKRVFTTINESKTQLSTEIAAKEGIKENHDVRESISQKQQAELKDAANKAQADLAARTKTFAEEKARVEEEKKQQKDTMQATIDQQSQQLAKLQEELQGVQAKLAQAEKQVATNAAEVRRLNMDVGDVPDGEIRWVDQRNRLVWVNLGTDDGLRVGVSFAVYPANTAQVDKNTARKGSIEITRMLQAHLAEARITDYELRDPLLPGDKVFSPVWHVGRSERFAMAGLLDVNSDGRPDNDVIRNLIAMTGGTLDAEVTPEGQTIGRGIELGTRYLIMGSKAGEAVAAGSKSAALREATVKMESDAMKNGVRIITLDQFLDLVGWTERNRVYNPDAGDEYRLNQGTSDRPKPNPTDPTRKLFQERRPPVSGLYEPQE